MNLNDLVERNDLIQVISDCHDQTLSVAFVEEGLNVVPGPEKVEELFKRLELDVGVEAFALLEDTDGQCLPDERSVFLETWHHFDSLSKG